MQIDVENPCVIMSQDSSREFLHSGNEKDKFKVCLHLFAYFSRASTIKLLPQNSLDYSERKSIIHA